MIMKNILKITFALALAACIGTSCIKETFPQGSGITKEQLGEAVEAQMWGLPASLNTVGTLSSSYHFDWGYLSIGMIRDIMCNDMSNPASGYDWYSAWSSNISQGENYLVTQFTWYYYWQSLKGANDLIGLVKKKSELTLSEKQALAVGYCYRALFYLDLGRMYEFKPNAGNTSGTPGLTVPWVDENTTESEASSNPRIGKTILAGKIEADLQAAVKLFADVEGDPDYRERTSKSLPDSSVAHGLLARLYLWLGDIDKKYYTMAATQAQEALNSSTNYYTVTTEEQWTSATSGFNTDLDSWMWTNTTTEEDAVVKTGLLNVVSWLSSETTYGYASAGPFRTADVNFYNQISDTDFRKLSWKAPQGSDLAAKNTYCVDASFQKKIPELASLKFRPGKGDGETPNVGSATSFPLMRAEEMHFIHMEALCHTAPAQALQELNQFMQTYRDPEYSFNSTNRSALLNEIIFQKRVEFWGEGIIYFDFKRLNLGVFRGYPGTNHYEDARFNTVDSYNDISVDVNGLAPWMNFVIVRSEGNSNPSIINNPDPSDTIDLWVEEQ